jgi:hypothetical protein
MKEYLVEAKIGYKLNGSGSRYLPVCTTNDKAMFLEGWKRCKYNCPIRFKLIKRGVKNGR